MADFTSDDFFDESSRQVTLNPYENFNFNKHRGNAIMNCSVCEEVFTSKEQFNKHLNTARHRNNKKPIPAMYEYNYPGGANERQEVGDPMKKFRKISTEQPVVGLEHVTEFYDFKSERVTVMVCGLCEVHSVFLKNMLDHVTGFKHKLKYLQLEYTDEYKLLLAKHRNMDCKEIKRDVTQIYSEIASRPAFSMQSVKIKSSVEYSTLGGKKYNYSHDKAKPGLSNKDARKREFQIERRKFEEEEEQDELIIGMNNGDSGNISPLLEEDDEIFHFLLEDARRSGKKRNEDVIRWMQPPDRKSLYLLISERERFSKSVARLEKMVKEDSMSEAEVMIKRKLKAALLKVEADIHDFLLHSLDVWRKEGSQSSWQPRNEGPIERTHSFADNFHHNHDSSSHMVFKNREELNSLRENILKMKKDLEAGGASSDAGEKSKEAPPEDARAFMEGKIFKALCEGSLAPIAKAFSADPDLQAALKRWEARQQLPSSQDLPEKKDDISGACKDGGGHPEGDAVVKEEKSENKVVGGDLTPPSFMQVALARSTPPLSDSTFQTGAVGIGGSEPKIGQKLGSSQKVAMQRPLDILKPPPLPVGHHDPTHEYPESYNGRPADHTKNLLIRGPHSSSHGLSSHEWRHELHEHPLLSSLSHHEFCESAILSHHEIREREQPLFQELPSHHELHDYPSHHGLHDHEFHDHASHHEFHDHASRYELHEHPAYHELHDQPLYHEFHEQPLHRELHDHPSHHELYDYKFHEHPSHHKLHEHPTHHKLHEHSSHHEFHEHPSHHEFRDHARIVSRPSRILHRSLLIRESVEMRGHLPPRMPTEEDLQARCNRYSRKFYENQILAKGTRIRMRRPPLLRSEERRALLVRPPSLLKTPGAPDPRLHGLGDELAGYYPRGFSGARFRSPLPKQSGSLLLRKRSQGVPPPFGAHPKFPRL